MSKFDDVALAWEENPVHLEGLATIEQKLEEMVPLSKESITSIIIK